MKTGRGHFLRTRTNTSVFIKAPGSQLSFSFPAGATISVVAEDQPEIVGDFESEGKRRLPSQLGEGDGHD
jgi:hypothetical protein